GSAAQPSGPSARDRLAEHLAAVAERVRAGGDLTDGPHLSPVERLVRAWERSDGTSAREILARAVGRRLP
ncbi:hypothetical protein, partial [Rubellimicrobium roseum]|uniref:hypothetical protein n=1 Tax=Rubellimicrobium roseum TaxID=687525 RepID=UPI001C3F43E8